ncbi:MAG: TetR family transcriptional regulator [Mobilibacterium timonense]|uniref:TetR family transcriptional regulator n=1 Tax=Mobilibacterium timonense TaxID=1871012 RepID=UPI002352B31E|nr:TetR family transcriptional regulator [Mobilibacterium timonense]MBM6991263.1 TetR family transcriptional regulator [Mobilibacterium timonense]
MAKVSREVVEGRPDEIMDACVRLHETMSFRDINLKEISCETSISRPSIYNYFRTKEEIFLGVLEREYRRWNDDLQGILTGHQKMTGDEFAAALAESLRERKLLLEIQSTDLYDIEENSRQESLNDFKEVFMQTMTSMEKLLEKFFPEKSKDERSDFVYQFFPFLYGVYPYVYHTEKQERAMDSVGMKVRKTTIEEMVCMCVLQLLK